MNDLKFVKVVITKVGIEKENSTFNDVEFSIILEQLILQGIPISFIRVLLELLLTIGAAWLIYPRLMSLIDQKHD